jgi:hypothetical protein
MTSVIIRPIGSDTIDQTDNVGVLKDIGLDEEFEGFVIENDNYERTFLVKNDDGSIEIFRVQNRTTADLVLPDNRIPTIFLVVDHRILKPIPYDTFGLKIVAPSDKTILESIADLEVTMGSLIRDGTYEYKLLDEEGNEIKSTTVSIEIEDNKPMNGLTILQEIQNQEQEQFPEINVGYLTLLDLENFSPEWIRNGYTIKTEKEKPIKLFNGEKKVDDEGKNIEVETVGDKGKNI